MALELVMIKIVKFELVSGRNLLNLKPSFKKGRGKYSCFKYGLVKTNGHIIHSHMENMRQLCIVVSCPELGRIEAVLQNVCVKCCFTLYTLKLAMDDSPCLEHVRDVMAQHYCHPLQCSTAWQAGLQKGRLFQQCYHSWSLKAFTPNVVHSSTCWC